MSPPKALALSLAPEPPARLAEWLEPSLQDTAGRDPLGLNTITLDRILPRLVPGILQLSQRARYFSIYAWMLWQFAERKRPATREELDVFIRRREYELCLAMKLCKRCDASSAIGANSAGPRVNAGDDPFDRGGLSVQSEMGGFGLYYRSPLAELGAVALAGTPIGPEERPTPIDVLHKTERSMELAEAFHGAIVHTEYYRRYERTDAPIPRSVLEDLADTTCLCRLSHRHKERDAVRRLLFTPPAEEAGEACDARRRAFAHFLSLLDGDGSVAFEDGKFWRGSIRRFVAASTVNGAAGETTASWAALAMKECVQDAICSIWTDFCRTGVHEQGHKGLSREGLSRMIAGLADSSDLELDGVRLAISPGESARPVQGRAVAAARGMDWEDVRAWAAAEDTAAAGLVALLVLAERLPQLDGIHPAWVAVAGQRSEHQDGLLGVLRLVRQKLGEDPTVVGLLEWAIQRFLVGPHEAIAYSKLPKATFRFYWEETGRLRFFTPGSGGLGRFSPSDDRRGTMSSLTHDLGFWELEEGSDNPVLTEDGHSFVAEAFG